MASTCEEILQEAYGPPQPETGPALRKFSVAAAVVVATYAVVPVALLWARRDLFPVFMRPPWLVTAQTCSVLSVATAALVRDSMDDDQFPCDLRLWLRSVLVPLVAIPELIMLAQTYNRVKLAKAMKSFRLTEESLDLAEFLKQMRRAGTMHEIKQFIALMVVPVALAIAPTIVYPQYGNGCYGCQDEPLLDSLHLGYAACLGIGTLMYKWQIKKEDDPLGQCASSVSVLRFGCGVGVIYLAFKKLDPGGLLAARHWNEQWLLLLIPCYSHALNVVRPVWATFKDPELAHKLRRRKKKRRPKATGEHAVVPDESAMSTTGDFMLSPSSGDKTITLQHILDDPEMVTQFQNHLAQEYNVENILFWKSATKWRDMYFDTPTPEARYAVAHNILESFITTKAQMQVNLQDNQRSAIEAAFQASNGTDIAETVFNEAIEEIYNLMKRDSFPRFRNTAAFAAFKDKVERQPKSRQNPNSSALSELSETQD